MIAVASVTFERTRHNDKPAWLEKIMDALYQSPGMLGAHTAMSFDHPGMFLIFSWWRDKHALNDFYYSEVHQGWIRGRDAAIAGVTTRAYVETGPSQVGIELLTHAPRRHDIGWGLCSTEHPHEMIIRLLRWLWPPSAPPLRQLPEALVRAIVFGAVVGLPLSFLVTPTSSWPYFWRDPWAWVLRASGIGITFAMSFYVACGLPVSYLLRSRLVQSSRHPRLIVWTTAIVGATLGCLTALVIFALRHDSVPPLLTRLAIADGVFAAILTIALSQWYALRAEKELADARALNSALRAQINPHFFFNTLSTIASLIKPNPEAAEHTIGLLADMSRYAFTSCDVAVRSPGSGAGFRAHISGDRASSLRRPPLLGAPRSTHGPRARSPSAHPATVG